MSALSQPSNSERSWLLSLASELLDRETAATSLLAFTEYTLPSYERADHHVQIADHLEAVVAGDLDRLIIAMPPRHGKSELASRRFPAWFLGRHPDKEIIAASYNADLARDFGREVRNLVASDDYQNVFPGVHLLADSRAADRWHTNRGGVYAAAGIGGSITGRGAHIGLIDDPIKSQEEADSELYRSRLWKWYRSTFYTRLMPFAGNPGGAVVVIQTRWHDDDLVGRLLNEPNASEWTVLDLPALGGPNEDEALWPERYPAEALQRIRDTVGPRPWSALYQQRPSPDDGVFYQRPWFHWYTPGEEPPLMRVYGASDYAVTEPEEGNDPDYTEHGVFGLDPHHNIYVLDWFYRQCAPDEWIEAQANLIDEWEPLAWAGEAGVIRRAVEPFLLRRLVERQSYVNMLWLPSIHDKPTRARAFQSRAAMGKVYLPRNELGERLLGELLRFPAGKHDDAPDVFALFGLMIHRAIAGDEEPEPPPDRIEPVQPTFNDLRAAATRRRREAEGAY